MFKHGDIYLMVTSGCTGWLANRAEVFYARRAAPFITLHSPFALHMHTLSSEEAAHAVCYMCLVYPSVLS